MMSAKYKKEATSLNATSWAAIGAGTLVLFLVFFFWSTFYEAPFRAKKIGQIYICCKVGSRVGLGILAKISSENYFQIFIWWILWDDILKINGTKIKLIHFYWTRVARFFLTEMLKNIPKVTYT
jgi:hypothetical protein